MGEILAMTAGMKLRPLRKPAMLALVLLLAACGNDAQQGQGAATLRQVAGTLISDAGAAMGRGQADATAAAPRSADQIAASALRANPGPLILATVEQAGHMQAMALIGESGGRRTFATPNMQALVLEGGMLAATRGLGHDLNAADSGPVAALIRGRRAGQATRMNYYLTGEARERALQMTCTVTPGQMQEYNFAGRSWSARQMAENCEGSGTSFANNYLVDGNGQIVMSRQWIGPALGHVVIQTIRP